MSPTERLRYALTVWWEQRDTTGPLMTPETFCWASAVVFMAVVAYFALVGWISEPST